MHLAFLVAAMSSSIFAADTAAKRWDNGAMLERLLQVFFAAEAEALMNATGLNNCIYSFGDGIAGSCKGFAPRPLMSQNSQINRRRRFARNACFF